MAEPNKKTILVVDDEIGLREAIAFDLKRQGYNVHEAGSGNEAFEIVKSNHIDLVLTDIRMPNGDGVTLLDQIKAHNPGTPVVIFITGFSDLTIEEAYNKGAEAVFAKPFDRKALLETIRRGVTPKNERWLQRSFERVMSNFNVELRFSDWSHAVNGKILNVGRGGMFVALSGPLPNISNAVAFSIRFDEGTPPAIEGHGIVRWVRAKTSEGFVAGCGIEFEDLTDEAIRFITDVIEKQRPIAYIPKN